MSSSGPQVAYSLSISVLAPPVLAPLCGANKIRSQERGKRRANHISVPPFVQRDEQACPNYIQLGAEQVPDNQIEGQPKRLSQTSFSSVLVFLKYFHLNQIEGSSFT